jgi:esterase/lipase superfamily enzyme
MLIITFICTLIVIIIINKLGIHQIYGKIVFLNDDFDIEVFMKQFKRFVVKKKLKFIKLLYSLK